MRRRPSARIASAAAAALLALVSAALASQSARADFSFVHVTDTHVTASNANDSPAARDAERFREISALTPKPAFVVATGDVCEIGTDAEYAVYRKVRDENLTLPMYAAPGNHDVRWNPRGKEGYVRGAGQPLYQSWDKENVHFVLLDSNVLLQHWGHFDQAELDWLAKDLARVGPDRPVIIGFHHWIGRESVQVDNEAALLRVLAPYNVRLFLIGHGHSDIQWSINGVPAIMAKGLYQGSYSLVRVTKDRLEVLRRTEKNKTPTEVALSVPLKRPAGIARSAAAHVADGRLVATLLRGDLPADATATCRLNDGKEVPLEPTRDGWTGTLPLEGVIPGSHQVTFTATTADKRAYQTIVALDLVPPRGGGGVQPVWKVNVGGAVQGKSISRDGMVYVPSMGGDLVALDGRTGKERWRVRTGGAIFSTPLVTDDSVYFGSADHKVYATDRMTGKVRWKAETDGAVFAGAALAQGIVCIGSTDTHIYGLDARTGKKRWTAKGEGMYQSQAATDGERFFVGGWDNQFRCLDVKTGRETWKQRFGTAFYYSPAIGSPTVSDGKVLVTSNDGYLHVMDAATGKLLWESEKLSLGYSSPLWDSGRVYNASLTGTGRVFCFNGATGAVEWEAATGAVIYDSSCVRGGSNIYVGCVNGTLSALRASDGHLEWQYRLAPGHLLTSPATDAERVYIGSMSGDVYAFPLSAPAVQR